MISCGCAASQGRASTAAWTRAVGDPRGEAEPRPDQEIAEEEERDEARRPATSTDERPERHHERDAARQHHRDDHQRPADRERGRADRDRGVQAADGTDAVMVQVVTVRGALPQPEGEPRRHGDRDERPGQDRSIAVGDAEVGGSEHRSVPSDRAVRRRSGSGPAGRCDPGDPRSGCPGRCRHACTGSPCSHTRANPGSC